MFLLWSGQMASDLIAIPFGFRFFLRASKGVRFVVMLWATISIHSWSSISLVVIYSCSVGAVNGDLVQVSSKSVSLGVRVWENSAEENSIKWWFNSWYQVGWREGWLFNFSEEIIWVFVKNKLSNWDKRVVLVGPYLGNILDIPFVGVSLSNWHNLNFQVPWWVVSLFNIFKEISSVIV